MPESRKQVPFAVNRNDGRKLVVQVADGLRKAVVSGYYKPGETLPTSRDLAPALGVSRIVTTAALRLLADEGWIDARPRIGSVVRERSAKRWRGHVVFAFPDGYDNYFQTVLACELRDSMRKEGYLFTEAGIRPGADGHYDFSGLEAALSQSVDLIFSMYARKEILRYLAKRGIPYAVCGEVADVRTRAVGVTRIDYNLAVPGFAKACRIAGVRRVVELSWYPGMCDVAGALKNVGIEMRKVRVDVDTSKGRFVAVRRAGMDAFAKLIGKGRISNNDLYFFSDDYLAEGALMALSFAGLRAPEDVRIATWANAGLGLVYPRELSRMEFDPVGAAKTVSNAVAEYLKTGKYPSGVVGARWFAGETMVSLRKGEI